MSSNIFIVEDDALTVAQLQEDLEEMGYPCVGTEDTAEAALAKMRQNPPDLVLMDIRLNGVMDGIEAAARLRADNGVAVLYLTAYADDATLARARRTEPVGYLVKPFHKQELKAAVEMGLVKNAAVRKQQRMLDAVVSTINEMVKLHAPLLYDAQICVGALAGAIATELQLPGREVKCISMAGLLHAIGSVAIPAELMAQRHDLMGAHKNYFQSYPEIGWRLLKDIEFDFPVAEMVYQHMERLDGSGFPRRLAGDAILPGARIVAVACQVADRLRTGGYRVSATVEEALAELEAGSGSLFDAKVVAVCAHLFRDKGFQLPPV